MLARGIDDAERPAVTLAAARYIADLLGMDTNRPEEGGCKG